jgi:hypothetical protein
VLLAFTGEAPIVSPVSVNNKDATKYLVVLLWILSIAMMIVWHPLLHVSSLDSWLGRPAEIPLAVLSWPVVAVLTSVLRRQRNIAAALMSVGIFSIVVSALILTLGTTPR